MNSFDLGVLLFNIFLTFNVAMGLAVTCIWLERKVSALIQDRVGANRAGAFFNTEEVQAILLPLPFKLPSWLNALIRPIFVVQGFIFRKLGMLGLINTLFCDPVKALLKEDFIPKGVSNFTHSLAPFMAAFPIFVAFALFPLAPDFTFFGHPVRLQVADLSAGILFFLALGSVAVYGVAFAGYTGNNKFSLMGGLRACAQMISYELAMGLCFITVIIVYGTLDLYEMIQYQSEHYFGLGMLVMPLTLIILFIVGMAETKRAPFDLPESESEIVAGYFTEYSGMKFLLFWFGEFAEIGLFALLISTLFLGGWNIPFIEPWLFGNIRELLDITAQHWLFALIGFSVFMTKVFLLCVFQVIVRWSLPRFRYDQLMDLGWKYLLPLSLLNLLITASLKVAGVI